MRARVEDLSFYYGEKQALKDLNFPVHDRKVTALIGPSGCGKSTLLRAFNRMHDLYPGNRYEGEVILYPEQINIVSPRGRSDAGAARRSEWCFRSPIRFRNRSMTMSLRACGSAASARSRSSTSAWSRRLGRRRCGTKSRIGCTRRPTGFPAASSSGCASRGRWRRSRKCCCSTSRPPPSIRSPPRASRG